MKILTVIYFLLMVLTAVAGWASGGGGHEGAHAEIEIPVKSVLIQAFNFGLLIVLLVYLLKKHIVAFFTNRHNMFHAHIQKSQALKKEAEEKHASIKEKIHHIEKTTDQSVETAKKEAEELRARIEEEAKTLSKKLKEDAAKIVEFEVEKAEHHLRQEIFAEAVRQTKIKLESGLNAEQKKILQDSFTKAGQA